jgi:hypothetical protein
MNDDPITPGDAQPTGNGTDRSGISRRSFVQTLGLSAAAGALAPSDAPARADQPDEARIVGPDPVKVTLRVNGRDMTATLDPATTLLDALRIEMGVTGSKEICDRGACGGCSVLVDGRLVPVRLLHAGARRRDQGPARREPETHPPADQAGAERQSLSLRDVHEHLQRRARGVRPAGDHGRGRTLT